MCVVACHGCSGVWSDLRGLIGDGGGGVRGGLVQKDGVHLSDWPVLKWPSLRID